MCGETFACEKCGFGDGDGNTLCNGCADVHCDDINIKDDAMVHKDAALIKQMLEGGVYSGTSKHDREKTIQSSTMRAILERLIENPDGVKDLLDMADDEATKKPAKRPRSEAAPPDVIIID